MPSACNQSDEFTIPMVITQGAKSNAQRFTQQQPSEQKAQQVYRNTLAVCVVNSYLQILGIETDLSASDSWNPVLRLANDIADLVIDKGKLECRWVNPANTYCNIPLEVQCDRIGYVIVRLDNEDEATILGFVEQVESDYLALSQLRSISELPLYLSQIHPTVNLRQWLEGIYHPHWQSPQNLLHPKQLALSNHPATIQRAKLIELNSQSEQSSFVLLISVLPKDDHETLSIRVQLHPAIVTNALPVGVRLSHLATDCLAPNISLTLQSATGTPIKEIVSRTYPRDNYIQIPAFQGQLKEHCTIQIAVHGNQVYEYFQL